MTPFPPMGAARSPRAMTHAFTLFELIVVLSILTILSSIAAPRYASAVARYRLDTAARRVAADVEQVKALARASGATRVIRFVPATHSYSILGYSGANQAGEYTVFLNQPPYSITLESANFAGAAELNVGGFGLPVDGGTVVVRGGAETRTITVDSFSGAVTVQ